MTIDIIGKPEFEKLMDSGRDHAGYRPLGRFILKDEEGEGATAVDNSAGEAFTEWFPSMFLAVKWLEGDENDDEMLAREFMTLFDKDCLAHLHESDEDFIGLVNSSYERLSGASCVNWRREDTEDSFVDTLPRDSRYETQGYTDGFWEWMRSMVNAAIHAGASNVEEIQAYVAGKISASPNAKEARPAATTQFTLRDFLPLVHESVKVVVDEADAPKLFSLQGSSGITLLEKLGKVSGGCLDMSSVLGYRVTGVAAEADATLSGGSAETRNTRVIVFAKPVGK